MFKNNLKSASTKIITFFYFFLLLYTIAALIWWGLLLHKQNKEIVQLKTEAINLQHIKSAKPALYQKMFLEIQQEKHLRNLQYLGEGSAFLLIILLSAGFVYQAMRRRIKFTRQQQNFILAVTHELKSPIAVVRLNMETLLKRKLPEDKQAKILEMSLAETNRLNRLSNNMLLASRFENKQYEIIKEPLDLSRQVEKLVSETKSRIKSHNIRWEITPGVKVEGDGMMLQIVCSNLIENAVKYAPAGSDIDVILERKRDKALLQFKDQGTGIPEAEKSKIFNRFYRVGNENTRKAQGTGLGLFLTKKIVQEHDGKIVVKDNNPNGSVFELTLPLKGK